MWILRLALLSCAAVLLAACSATSNDPAQTQNDAFTVVNPSGDCAAEGNGDRAAYHASAGTVWVPDCQNPLAREYWRVFATDSEHAYLIPRPDGAPELQAACENASDPLHELVRRYPLCASATSSAEVDAVNHLTIADALTLARALHGALRFTHQTTLAPFAPPTDILDACGLHPLADVPELEEMCARAQQQLDSGNDIGFTYDGPGATQLAQRLNELYGITASSTLACVRYADGVCDEAADCGGVTLRRVVCAAACTDPGSEVRSYCVREVLDETVCRAEVATGDLFGDFGGISVNDPEHWRDCTGDEQVAFDAAVQ